MGARSEWVAGCINLLQQTPLDRPLGDVMVHYPGALRLIEFKRPKADWAKELTKREMLSAAISARPPLQVVSRAVHWFVESGSEAVPRLHIAARPHLDMESSSPRDLMLEAFAEMVVNDGLGESEFDPSILNEYQHAVTTFSRVKDLLHSIYPPGVSARRSDPV